MGNRFLLSFTLGALLLAGCAPRPRSGAQEQIATATPANGPMTFLPLTVLPLNNLQQFRKPQDKGWQVVGDVYADRVQEGHMELTKGTGILAYTGKGTSPSDILTQLEHGDLDLELDFLLAKGSKASILLQGRYEVQLADSWLKENLTGQDAGAVAGKAPAQDAARAPGLWQHLVIHFKAPRFDASGQKVTDARLERLVLNGQVVQEQVPLKNPTNATTFSGEQAQGPLVLRAGTGPVAFKDIRYKAYSLEQIALHNMHFKLYEGLFKSLDAMEAVKPIKSGPTDTLSFRMGTEDTQLVLEGEMEVPRTGEYLFRLSAGGGAWLFVDGEPVVLNNGSRNYQRFFYGSRILTQGSHPFRLVYGNNDESLVLHYEGPGIAWTPLTTPSSQRQVKEADPMPYVVKEEVAFQRGFMRHQGKTKTFAASVGIPGGLNFAYDLQNYSPLSVWHGQYIDVSHMWDERGEKQLEVPLGAPLHFSGRPTVAVLAEQNSPWPDSILVDSDHLRNRGYKLRPDGLPVFFYTLGQAEVEDYLAPTADRNGFVRQITVRGAQADAPLYCLLGSGSRIEKLPNGSYAINDKAYYIEGVQGAEPVIRDRDGQYELIVPLTSAASTVTYSIIW